ncbi:MAG: hypothetical protein ONB44_07715 [candidate division KSB1 bacterium]|nr:hypothetical protein [candidate division KSB1 bacterium]MDZ7302014.1 hypothetical protein [candidate division KSB1 bacterium]MDZ7310196.1 hypothetical protein [candidate division KSB1 bacterium]
MTAIHFESINFNGIYTLSDLRQDSFRVTGTGRDGSPRRMTFEVFPDSIACVQGSP